MPESIVLQWARMGDLLQTRVLLRDLKAADHRVTLCCDARYQDLASLFPEVDHVWPVDLAAWNRAAQQSILQSSLLQEMTAMINRRPRQTFERAFVLNRSLPAALFAELLEPNEISGYRRCGAELQTPLLFKQLEDRRRHGEIWPIHIADIWADLSDLQKTREWLTNLPLPKAMQKKCSPCVGVFCDAGEPDRMVPFAWLQEVVEGLACAGIGVKLFGVSNGQRLTSNHSSEIIDRRGKTSLRDLIPELSVLDIVIGSDSGGLHLAAALAKQVIGFYFSSAHAVNTGPVAPRARVIENMEWTSATANAVAQDIQMLCMDSNLEMKSEWWQEFVPQWDRQGLCYLPTDSKSTEYHRIRYERQQMTNVIFKQNEPVAIIS